MMITLLVLVLVVVGLLHTFEVRLGIAEDKKAGRAREAACGSGQAGPGERAE